MKHLYYTLVIFLACIAFLGCNKYNKDVATRQVTRAALSYEDVLAKYCFDKYVQSAKVDSTGYATSVKAYNKVVDSLKKELAKIEEAGPGYVYLVDQGINPRIDLITDSIENELKLRYPASGSTNCDSISEPLFRIAAQANREALFYKNANAVILAAAKNLKPVIQKEMDISGLRACELEKKKMLDIIAEANLRAAQYKNGRNSWRKIALASSGLALLWLFFKLRSRKK